MKAFAKITFAWFCGLISYATADQGSAASSGACMHVIGKGGSDGTPLDFTCSDVGGAALLVWNASPLTGTINVSGGIRTVNLYPGNFTVDGTFSSDGPLAFIGGGITVNGSITGSSVLIAGMATNATEVSNTLLGSTGRISSSTLAKVDIKPSGNVTATSGNVTVVGDQVANEGKLTAKAGIVTLITGTKLNAGWNDAEWEEGVHRNSRSNHSIRNDGTIVATHVVLEAHRASQSVTSITNAGTISVKSADKTVNASITFVTGLGGNNGGTGDYGVQNTSTGRLYAAEVTIKPYEAPPPAGTGAPRTYIIKDPAERQQLITDIRGGQVFVPQQDNTPVTTTAATLDAGRSFTVTSDIVLPQLAPSLTHLNAASNQTRPMLVASKHEPEQVRGDTTKPSTSTKPKARTKAKPVLVRGAFFNSKISATVAHNP